MLNGPPACGKSTLARRYVEDHPLALDLDVDRIRDLIGGWRDHAGPAGLLARAVALAAARADLPNGHDVIVPQLLTRPGFIEQAERVAYEVGADFHEIVLMDSRGERPAPLPRQVPYQRRPHPPRRRADARPPGRPRRARRVGQLAGGRELVARPQLAALDLRGDLVIW
ncbi:hypothetical protein O7606_23320 [Micromonospora sp. WMMD882]|uniref:AAA family ATPase n=1 Tax=Micromonospora sp. WMMD882 TaxID=3015151 RepID=UPI00248C9EDF|nr:AAA family ATPase [Micromonospora sp. WMMD882]WBB79083.1 hypothetical protein O7606_23320 [Micromonospora sp. WMMD882]